MKPKKNISNNQKQEKQQLEEKVNKFVQENDGLSVTEIINKAQQSKPPTIRQSSIKNVKSNQKQEQQIKQQKSEIDEKVQSQSKTKQKSENNLINITQQQSQSIIQQQSEIKKTTISINEKQLELKLKEKQREIQLLNDKQKLLETENQELKNQIIQYKNLLNEKQKVGNNNYNQRRYLVLCQNIINKQQQIFRLTQVVQVTRNIQYELENQLINLQQLMENNTDSFEGAYKIGTFCEKQLERLRYIQSQQLHEQEIQFEQRKNIDKKTLEYFLKIDSCIFEIIKLFDSNRIQFNFIDEQLISQLDALSMNLNRIIQGNELPKINLKPNIIILQEEQQRIQGSFISLFPHYNNMNELIKKQIQNDQIYQKLDDISQESKNLKDTPLGIRQINILKSIIIHCLLSIHTFNFMPILKPFFEQLKPILEDCQNIYLQYNENNTEMGQKVLWEIWKQNNNKIFNCIELTQLEIQKMKQQYQGYWNHKFFDYQQK